MLNSPRIREFYEHEFMDLKTKHLYHLKLRNNINNKKSINI